MESIPGKSRDIRKGKYKRLEWIRDLFAVEQRDLPDTMARECSHQNDQKPENPQGHLETLEMTEFAMGLAAAETLMEGRFFRWYAFVSIWLKAG